MKTNDRTFLVASGATTGSTFLEDWDTYGLLVPSLTSSTLKVQVSNDNSTWQDLKDGGGTAVLSWAAGTGDFAVASRDMVDIAGYRFMRVVCGTAQGADRTFTLTFKCPRRQ